MPATVVGETGSSVVGAWLVACVSDSSWTANIDYLFCGGVDDCGGVPQGSHRPARGRVAHSIEALADRVARVRSETPAPGRLAGRSRKP